MEDNGGVFVRVPIQGEGLDLYRDNFFERTIHLGKMENRIGFKETEEEFDEVHNFFYRSNAMWAYVPFLWEGFTTLQ
jgi:hypothetical protein